LQGFIIFFGEKGGRREALKALRVRAAVTFPRPIKETTLQTTGRKIRSLLRE
jgi:hypothetical protein